MRLSFVRRLRLIVYGCLACGLAATGVSLAAREATKDLTTLTERLDELAQEKTRVRRKLKGVKERQRQVTRQLVALDSRLEEAEARLNRVNRNVYRTRSELEEAKAQIENAEARLTEQKDSVSERLLSVYQRGQARPLEVLLQSASFADFANRLYLLNQVIARDAEILDEFAQAQADAEALHADLKQRSQELEALKSRIADEKQRTSHERKSTERQKQDLLRDRAAWERALAELEQDSREIENMLQRVQKTPEGRERSAKPWTGKFRMPVSGRTTSSYGYRRHPIYGVRKLHTGIDIAASSGTKIRCAGDGTVVHASRWGGYGNCIIVDHGGGLATLYGHCSRLAVTNGQQVTHGQVIGYVGSTGLSTGPHLHFEVRKDGRPVNPEPYL
ncbi:MAG TPA: peptidoglycan DD-metalloendopeptidase family protein [Armatimonadota bacterium]|nr:peptidoglycan DD-metalloendopeptidase family protein [Armatimonadota bacterium]